MVLFTPSNGHEFSRKARTAKLNLMFNRANIPLAGLLRRKDPLYVARADLVKLGKISVFISKNFVHSSGAGKFREYAEKIQDLISQCDDVSSKHGLIRDEKLKSVKTEMYKIASSMESLYPTPGDFGYSSRWSSQTVTPRDHRIEGKRKDFLGDLREIAGRNEPARLLDFLSV